MNDTASLQSIMSTVPHQTLRILKFNIKILNKTRLELKIKTAEAVQRPGKTSTTLFMCILTIYSTHLSGQPAHLLASMYN